MGTDQHSSTGAEVARTIEEARRRHLPLLTRREAARQAGISGEGWRKAINSGRAREETFLAMARVVDVEVEVRKLLGLGVPADKQPTTTADDAHAALIARQRRAIWEGLADDPEERDKLLADFDRQLAHTAEMYERHVRRYREWRKRSAS